MASIAIKTSSGRRGNVTLDSGSAAASSISPAGKMDDGFNFIHFGCWNNAGCGEGFPDTGLTHTMNALQEQLSEIKPELVLVTGDNYYPSKTKTKEGLKIKQFVAEEFDSGWNCLKTTLPLDKTYVLMGNHDLETKPGTEECVINDESAKMTAGPVVNKVELCDVKVIGSTMFVMLTSSIFDTEFDTEGKLLKREKIEKLTEKKRIIERCSALISELTGKELHDLNAIRSEAQKIIIQRVFEKVKEYPTIKIVNLVFACHDPLVCYKYKSSEEDDDDKKEKKEEKKEKDEKKAEKKEEKKEKSGKADNENTDKKVLVMPFGGEPYMDMLCGIIEKVKPRNTYYLCADLHQYQEGIITINCDKCGEGYKVHQSISGTGGAKQDKEIPQSEADKKNDNPIPDNFFGKYEVKYNMLKSIQKYGFTTAKVNSRTGDIIFIPPNLSGPVKEKKDKKDKKEPSTQYVLQGPMEGGARRVMHWHGAKTTNRRHGKRILKVTMKKW
jgi:hypothetical protein